MVNGNTKMHNGGEILSYKAKKPHHVRRLSFGETSLTSNVVNQFGDGIPCTNKGEFVSMQAEACIDYTLPTIEIFYWSPALGSRKCTKPDNAKEERNIRRNLLKSLFDTVSLHASQYVPLNVPLNDVPLNASPILGRNSYKRKRRKRLQRKVLDHIENIQVESNAGSSAIGTKVYNEPKEVVSPVLGGRYCRYKRRQRRPKKEHDKVTDNCVSSSKNTTDPCNLADKGKFEGRKQVENIM